MNYRTQKLTRTPQFTIDSSFILFCLALEFGRSLGTFSLETVLFAFIVGFMAIASFWLPKSNDETTFGNWLLTRFAIVGIAAFSGVLFDQFAGTIMPETFKFLPTTLLLVTSMAWTFFQFYGFLKVAR